MMMIKRDSTVIIDIEKLQNYLEDEMDHYSAMHDLISKSKVQSSISKVKQVHGTHNFHPVPVVVSIGPYHHGKNSLKIMERIKWNCLEYILGANGEKKLDDYVKMLQELFSLIMSYYQEEIEMRCDELVKMFLLDGCFLLLTIYHGVEVHCNIPNKEDLDNYTNLLLNRFVIDDLFVVENQIPFLVVEKIHELFTSDEESMVTTLSVRAAQFMEKFLSNFPKSIPEHERPKSFSHLLHLCHIYLRPSKKFCSCLPELDTCRQPMHQWHKASQYQTTGVKFQKREFDDNNPPSLLDIRFSNCVLEIPYLQMHQSTIVIFRNLIAFEQANPQFHNDITSYIIFLSQLVTDAQHAAILVSKGIIQHHFGSDEEVSNMLKELSQGIKFDFSGRYYLKNICYGLEEYYQTQMKWILGWLKRKSLAMLGWIHNY